MGDDLLRFARKYAAAGFCVIPIKVDGSKRPDVSSWKPFQESRPTDDDLRHWFGNGTPHGIAIVWGRVSGNGEALDFDAPGIFEKFEQLAEEHDHGDLIRSLPLVETPSGGRHLLYRCSKPVEGNKKLAQRLVEVPTGTKGARHIGDRWYTVETLIETRGEGGYTIAPGSPAACHPDGKLYRKLRGSLSCVPTISAEERNILHGLAAVFNEFIDPKQIKVAPTPKRAERTAGTRPGDDFEQRMSWEDLLQPDGWTIAGRRGDVTLWRRPGKDGRGYSATTGYAHGTSGADLLYVFSSSCYPLEPEHAYSRFSYVTHMRHGGDFAAAARELGTQGYGDQTPPEVRREIKRAERELQKQAKAPEESRPEAPLPSFAQTDIGNAQRLVHWHGADLRYCYAWGKWCVWDGQRWRRDDTGEIDRRAKDTARRIFLEAAACVDEAEQKAIGKHAIRTQTYARLQAMIALAAPEVPVRIEEWDRDRWLLACDNGTVDLRTGELRESRREDLITKKAGAAFDPDAPAPTWERFLERILPDPEVRAFVQRAIGYGLTGDVSEQVLFFLYGSGSNGKSTLIRAILDALSDYGKQAAPDLLIAKEGAGVSNDVADLQGARFVATIEVEDGKRMAEGLVKQITGGDRIKARFMRQDFFEFEPTHKIFLAANHKPTIRGNDYAIWRRIKVLPFEVQIDDTEKDPQLPEKLRAELAGILAWAVRGCLEWRRIGLAEPEAVKLATAEYREEMDVLRDFLADCCILRPSLQVTGAALYQTYCAWCEENGDRALGKKSFTQRLREQRGIMQAAGIGAKAARGWIGVGLRADRELPGVSDTSDTSDTISGMSNRKIIPREAEPDFLSEVSEVSEEAKAIGSIPPPLKGDGFAPLDTSDIEDPFSEDDAE